jgi:hypothetical protein
MLRNCVQMSGAERDSCIDPRDRRPSARLTVSNRPRRENRASLKARGFFFAVIFKTAILLSVPFCNGRAGRECGRQVNHLARPIVTWIRRRALIGIASMSESDRATRCASSLPEKISHSLAACHVAHSLAGFVHCFSVENQSEARYLPSCMHSGIRIDELLESASGVLVSSAHIAMRALQRSRAHVPPVR